MKKDEITLKNTKQEILDALNAALEREKNNAKIKSNPEQEEKVRKAKAAVEETKKNVEANIFSSELINKFKDLELAIKTEEEKLKNLYDIDSELLNLTMVMNTGKDTILEFEKNNNMKKQQLEEQIKQLEEEYKLKTEELQKEYDVKSKMLKTERERETEEYNYKTKREREIANNKWEDEKKVRENNLKSMEEETQRLLKDAKEKENYLLDLEKQVANFSKELESEYERGKKDASESLGKEHKYEMEMLKKDFQNTIDRQKDKIESLMEEIQKANDINNSLQEKMDKAYVELKELATKTVEANGGLKIISNNQTDNKLV